MMGFAGVKLLLVYLCCVQICSTKSASSGGLRHHVPKVKKVIDVDERETSAEFWRSQALNTLNARVDLLHKRNVAKNVIFFLGDGMSLATLAATRVYLGGENSELSFEKFPHTALSKTYCVDVQVADSACTATAYLSGIKTNDGTIGVTANVPLGDCQGMSNSSNHVHSIAYHFQLEGKSTGLVTTTRVTHASPAGVYANTAHRDWEADFDVTSANEDPDVCVDIAKQLTTGEVGKNLNVIFGGGRGGFIPRGSFDEEGNEGYRNSENLIQMWRQDKEGQNKTARYIYNRDQLLSLDTSSTDYALGLFDHSHMAYELDRDRTVDPSLSEMTGAAIEILSKNSNGYFLFVEGGNIDRAHHDAKARKSLAETAEFSNAIQVAVNLTSEEDTLIVVTSDHSHTLTVSGYPVRGNDIFGLAGELGDDGLPYTTLGYANGPGYKQLRADGSRYDLTNDDFSNINYQYHGIAPKSSETHGGDDVIIFARGPWAHLYSGVLEQNVIPHFMAYASCVGEHKESCEGRSSSTKVYSYVYLIVLQSLCGVLLLK